MASVDENWHTSGDSDIAIESYLGLPFVDLLSFYILLFEKEGLK